MATKTDGGKSTAQKDLARHLITALRQDGFVLYAQAIVPVTARGDERLFQEILVRYREEEENLLPPGSFFPMLEEYRLMPYVDRWVISRLAAWFRSRRSEKPDWPAPRWGVNISADTLHDPSFGEYARRHIENAAAPEATFAFEVPLEMAVQEFTPLTKMMTQLKPAGCRFTFARFDGSEASFEFLKKLTPDFVKFQYGVVKDIDRSLAALEQAESINTRCRALGITTVAEYVESREVLQQLRLIGVDYAQGLAVSPPLPLR